MGRGGTRHGAGRPPLLDALERLAVGAECQAAYHSIVKSKLDAELTRLLTEQSEYAYVIAELTKKPDRKRFIESDEYAAHSLDVEEERHAIAGTDPKHGPASRLITLHSKRPQGVWPKIYARVALKWTERIGKPVSVHTVQKCHKECRAFLKSLEAESF